MCDHHKYPDNVIRLDNLTKIKELFATYRTCRIFGKGPTFRDITEYDDSILHVGINQAANQLTKCDVVVLNDIENIYKIDEDTYRRLKFIVIPEFPNIAELPQLRVTWRVILDKVSGIFNGHIIVYNLTTNPYPNSDLISLPTTISGTHTMNDFVCIYLKPYVKKIDFYGVAMPGNNTYNPLFGDLPSDLDYDERKINMHRRNIMETCQRASIAYKFN